MSYLVTGAAGFIGFHVAKRLLENGETVVGVDNINDYYDPALKHARLELLEKHSHFHFQKIDIADRSAIEKLGQLHADIAYIIHLAAQAGVRYSLENPHAYTHSNIEGQLNILELARHLPACQHLVYASSSSVYGSNKKLPFSTSDQVDHPVSLYAATKKAGELMAHCYSHLYKIPTTGLRFFTVYGPWGRPDMAYFLFVKAILAGESIKVFNQGDMRRDFTYIDDIVEGIVAVTHKPSDAAGVPYQVFNIGNNRSESLLDFISAIEKALGQPAKTLLEPMQPGDVKDTFADIEDLAATTHFRPKTGIQTGIPRFVQWYRQYYKI